MSTRPDPDLAIAPGSGTKPETGPRTACSRRPADRFESTNQRRAWWPARRFPTNERCAIGLPLRRRPWSPSLQRLSISCPGKRQRPRRLATAPPTPSSNPTPSVPEPASSRTGARPRSPDPVRSPRARTRSVSRSRSTCRLSPFLRAGMVRPGLSVLAPLRSDGLRRREGHRLQRRSTSCTSDPCDIGATGPRGDPSARPSTTGDALANQTAYERRPRPTVRRHVGPAMRATMSSMRLRGPRARRGAPLDRLVRPPGRTRLTPRVPANAARSGSSMSTVFGW